MGRERPQIVTEREIGLQLREAVDLYKQQMKELKASRAALAQTRRLLNERRAK